MGGEEKRVRQTLKMPHVWWFVALLLRIQSAVVLRANVASAVFRGPEEPATLSGSGSGGFDSDSALRNHLGEQVPVIGEQEQHLAMAPRLVKQPLPVYYTTQKSPALIECIADHSSYVTIHCNGKVLNRKVEILSDHESAERQKFSVPIEFADVQHWAGKGGEAFYCNCEAWNNVPELNNTLRKVVSDKAYVRLAYFDSERFQFDPVPLNVSRDTNNVILSCTPPTGNPKPQVKWLKDGMPLEVSGMGDRVTIDHQKQLIIRPLTLDDRGNYSCVAEIPGQQVHSKPAQLWIYVDGGWSTWSLWEACDARCDSPTDCPAACFTKGRVRHRQCDNPSPQFGGSPCVGETRQKEPCDIKCIVHGAWGEWTQWNYCGPDCQSVRHRSCTQPAPRNGGQPCPALLESGSSQSRNCSDGLCKKEDIALLRYINGNGKTVNPDHVPGLNNVAVYIGLFVAATVIITVAMVIIFLVRRKSVAFASRRRSLRCNMHTNGNCSTISSNDKDGKHTNELLLPQELSGSGTTIKNPNVIEMSQQQNLHNPKPYLLQQQQQQQGDQALRVHLPMSSTYQSFTQHQQQQQQQLQQVFPYSTCYASSPLDFNNRPCSALYHELGLDSRGVSASYVPTSVCPDQLAWGSIGASGGRLCLAESGISLNMPTSSLPATEEIFLSVCREPADRPPLTERQTLLSPVIACGPSGVSLSRHAVLTLPHSACLRQGFWNAVVLCRWDPADGSCGSWRELLRVGQEATQQQQQLPQAAFCQMDQSACHLLVPRLGRYCLVGQSLEGGSAAKQLRLAAFAAPLVASPDFSLRIHVLPDTPDALHQVITTELQSGARLLDSPKQLLFKDCGNQLCFNIEELSMGWRSKSKHQEIPFTHVWSGATSGLHCAFSLEHVDPTRQSVSCKIVIYQHDNYSLRQVVHIVSSKSDLPCVSPGASSICPTKSMLSDSGIMGLHADPMQIVFRLPPRLRLALCHLLDAPSAQGSDWRMLSRKMGIERCVNFFACQTSPTECLLDLWEARCREEDAVAKLAAMLTAMNRLDAVGLLEQRESAHWL